MIVPAVRVPSSARARAHGAWRACKEGYPPPPSHFRVLACALHALCACAARRAQRRGAPPLRAARVRVSADSRAPRRGGGERGTGTYHPHHHAQTPPHVRTHHVHEEARFERPSHRPGAGPPRRAGPSHEPRGIAPRGREGRGGGAPSTATTTCRINRCTRNCMYPLVQVLGTE